MSRIDLQKQQCHLARLREELTRLNRDFDALKERMGIKSGDEVAASGADVPAQLVRAMEEAAKKAKQASDRDVLAMKCDTEQATAVHAPRARRGSIAI